MRLLPFKSHTRRLALVSLALLMGARGDSCTMSIGPNGLCASLRLDPENSTVRVNDTFRIQINADGCSSTTGCACGSDATANARWTSNDSAVATVDSTGLVTARHPGSTVIEVSPRSGSWTRTRIHVTVSQ